MIRSFNEDKPYDRFLVEQIAADRLPLGDDKRPLAALGFLTVGRRFLNDNNEIIDDRIDVVTRGLMGLSVTCARCHDHKFDPIPTEDYYSLHGVFASSVEPDELPLLPDAVPEPDKAAYDRERQARLDKVAQREGRATRRRSRPSCATTSAPSIEAAVELNFEPRSPKLDEIARAHKVSPERLRFVARRLARLFAKTGEGHDPVFAPWRGFAALPPGEFEPKAAELAEEADRRARPREADRPGRPQGLRGRPAQDARRGRQALRDALRAGREGRDRAPTRPWQPIRDRLAGDGGLLAIPPDALDRVLNRAEREKLEATEKKVGELDVTHPGSPARAMVLNDAPNPTNPHVFIRGNPGRPGKQVPRRFLRVLSPGGEAKPFTDGSGRLELARAIASPDNPLTARVMVNRIWHDHFGVGLVATPSDFGARGEPPTHPELLDFLARRFVESGWSVKAMHRLILLSTTYQQKSDRRDDGFEADPTQSAPLAAEPPEARLRVDARRGPRRRRQARPQDGRPARRAVQAEVALDPPDRLRLRRPLRPRRHLPDLRLPQPRHQRPDAADHHGPAAGPLPHEQPVPARPGQGPRQPPRPASRRPSSTPGSPGSTSNSSAAPPSPTRSRSAPSSSKAGPRPEEARRARPPGKSMPRFSSADQRIRVRLIEIRGSDEHRTSPILLRPTPGPPLHDSTASGERSGQAPRDDGDRRGGRGHLPPAGPGKLAMIDMASITEITQDFTKQETSAEA